MEVKGKFDVAESCPGDRITVKQAGRVQPQPVPAPPPEVAADPERRAVYYEAHRAADTTVGNRIFLVEGCGARKTYICDYSGGSRRVELLRGN
jgi:hypothetical protein